MVHEIYLEQEVGSNRKFIKCSRCFLGDKQDKKIIFIPIQIHGNYKRKKLLFGKNLSLLRLAILVKPQCLYKERYFTIESTHNTKHKAEKQNSASSLENPDLAHNIVLIYLLIFFSSLWRVYVDLRSLYVEELKNCY